jgi:predicted amidohydrolase YtcJ
MAVRTALDLIEQIGPVVPAVIAHTELVTNSDLIRFAELNVTANFEPLWAREDGQLLTCVPQLGRDRLDTMYRMRDLVTAGARISFGSDWPVSNPTPMLGIATAVTRSLPGGESWIKEQALNVREALTAYTSGVSAQLSKTGLAGTLEAGQSAEFVVLSGNPLSSEDSALFDISVVDVSTMLTPLLNLPE